MFSDKETPRTKRPRLSTFILNQCSIRNKESAVVFFFTIILNVIFRIRFIIWLQYVFLNVIMRRSNHNFKFLWLCLNNFAEIHISQKIWKRYFMSWNYMLLNIRLMYIYLIFWLFYCANDFEKFRMSFTLFGIELV